MATKRDTTEQAQAAIKAAQETAAEWVEVERLHGWEHNPKRHPDAQVADLMRSIKRFGWGAVILARPNGEIIAGHGRLEAAKRLGLAKVPVRWLNLDPTEAHLLALADNKLTEIGEWDDALVREILEGAKQEGADITGLGWSEDQLQKIMQGGLDELLSAEPQLGEIELRVVVTCKSEEQQAELLARLEEEGFKCQALMS
jgi:ParB-like chromosome segregation protein Spo0J